MSSVAPENWESIKEARLKTAEELEAEAARATMRPIGEDK